VLFSEDARGEGLFRVVLPDGDRALFDDGAGVEALVDQMDRAAGDFGTVVEGLPLGVEAWEGGKEARMDVQDPFRVGGDEATRQEPHVAGEADPIDLCLREGFENSRLVRLSVGDLFVIERRRLETSRFRFNEPFRLRPIRHDDSDLGRHLTALDRRVKGLEVAPSSGEKNADPYRSHSDVASASESSLTPKL